MSAIHLIVRDQRFMRQFLMFAAVGTAGFVIDAAVLLMLLRGAGFGPYVSRLLSFLCAATFTWATNRLLTFADHNTRRDGARQWMKYLVINAIGGAINLGVYAILFARVASVANWPVLGVAAGSLAGLLFNFTLSRYVVFGAHSARASDVEPTRNT